MPLSPRLNRALIASLNLFFKLLLGCYRVFFGFFFGGSCRFHPTCSEYASQCLAKHDILSALKLIFIRLSKCRPYGPQGYDPIPEVKSL